MLHAISWYIALCVLYVDHAVKVLKNDKLRIKTKGSIFAFIAHKTNSLRWRCHMCATVPSHRDDYSFTPSQWETALLCNDVSDWLGASLESVVISYQYRSSPQNVHHRCSYQNLALQGNFINIGHRSVYNFLQNSACWKCERNKIHTDDSYIKPLWYTIYFICPDKNVGVLFIWLVS